MNAHKNTTMIAASRLIRSLGVAALLAAPLHAQLGLPGVEQDEDYNCGPSAAASALGWFDGHGFPNLIVDPATTSTVRDNLGEAADTDTEGTRTDLLKKAINDYINAGPYKNQIKANYPSSPAAYRSFNYIDTQFAAGKPILILFRFPDEVGNHYVAVDNWTNPGGPNNNTRTLSFMDPATGNLASLTVTLNGTNMNLTYNNMNGRIGGILTLCKVNSTESTIVNVQGGKKITYKPYFPADKKCKDLHVKVRDANAANYTVDVPAGWTWSIHQVGGQSYLSIYQNGSANDITSGTAIEVIYTGGGKVGRYKRILNQTTTGVVNPALGAMPVESGAAIVSFTDDPEPERVRGLACSVLDTGGETVAVSLSWDPGNDPSVDFWEVHDLTTHQLLGTTFVPQWTIPALAADVIHELVVVAHNDRDLYGEDSTPVLIHKDQTSDVFVQPGGPQALSYTSPLWSSHGNFNWAIDVPGAFQPGMVQVTALDADHQLPLPPGPIARQGFLFHVSTDAQLQPGPIGISLPYAVPEILGDENRIRLLALTQSGWQDVTQFVDTASNRVNGVLDELDVTLAVVGTTPLGESYCQANPNSTGAAARIAAFGSNLVAHNDLTLVATDLPQDQFGYFLTSKTEGFVAGPGGSHGNLCLGGMIGRFATQVQNSGSEGRFALDVDVFAIPVSPTSPILPGETWRFQAWFRDIEVAPTSNFTDGVWIEWQ